MIASAALPPAWLAGVLLVGRTIGKPRGLACARVDAILEATGASKSRAYEVADTLAAALPELVRAPGRPGKEPVPAAPDAAMAVMRAVRDHVMTHPGCVDRGGERLRCSDDFRRFVIRLRAEHDSLPIEVFADAVGIPLGTLKDWLRTTPGDAPSPPAETIASAPTPASAVETLHIQTVLDAWPRWEGTFIDFCRHARRDLHVPFGRDLVRRVLAAHRQRIPARREGRSPDEIALRGAFRTWFPGAQWVGDGMEVPVVVDGQRFVFNVEFDVDACSGAFVGVSVRDAEDSEAVVEAFDSGVATTGEPPLALLLDNKPCNHSPVVDTALGDTILIRATPERPQDKAHVEGAFGLFSQVLPPLVIDTSLAPHDIARRFLGIAVDLWTRTTNHRPRKGRGGRSRADLYADVPTDEQIEQARCELREIAARQEQARQTSAARCRPEVLALLDESFARLGLDDPERHVRIAIARYPLDAIVGGISVFDARQRAKTLPDRVDARYLLGIVRNIAEKTEGELFAEILYRNRVELRERFLARLRDECEALCSGADVMSILGACVEKATAIPAGVERSFWLDAIVETLGEHTGDERQRLYLHAARLVEATFAVEPRERHDIVRYIADRLVPVA